MTPDLRQVRATYLGAPVVPFNGETLASFIARWLALLTLPRADRALAAVTGGNGRQLSMSLPCRLEWIRTHFQAFAGKSHDEMVSMYSTLPVYRPFMSASKWEDIARQLAGEAASKSARARLGLLRPGHEKLTPMHCRECLRQQVRQVGTPFWTLRFALPYVVACPVHRLMLEQMPSVPLVGHGTNSGLAIPLHPDELAGEPASPSQAQMRISKLAIELQALNIPAIPGELIVKTYAKRMRELGFAQAGGRINRGEWAHATKEYWEDLEVASAERLQPWWTRAMHTKVGTCTASPLHHLLMIGVLFGRVAEWHAAIERNRLEMPPSRADIQSKWLATLPVQGARQVQLRVWVARGSAPPACAAAGPLPAAALELLKSGLPVSSISKQTGVSRSLLYRRLWANEALACEWAVAALQREIRLRTGGERSNDDSGPVQTTVAANRSWVYRHRSAFALLQKMDNGFAQLAGDQLLEDAAAWGETPPNSGD